MQINKGHKMCKNTQTHATLYMSHQSPGQHNIISV